MIKYLIWDFDGVICNSKKIAFENHNKICHKYNLPSIKKDSDYLKVISDEKLKKYISSDEISLYYRDHRELMYKNCREYKVFNKIIEFIKKLEIESIIITATYEKIVKEVLNNNGVNPNIFKFIIGRETEGCKLQKMQKICRNLNINNNEIIYIGDTINDIEFCKKLKIPMIAVGYGYCHSSVLNKKNVLKVCKSEEELINYIKKIVKNGE